MSIKSALESILAEVESHSEGRAVKIVAVSKRQSVQAMKGYQDIASAKGIQVVFGENYVQELAQKKSFLGTRLNGTLQVLFRVIRFQKLYDWRMSSNRFIPRRLSSA